MLQSIEAERNKQGSQAERLQERLSRAQEEISSLQSSMAQRASHYQSLHTELLDKVSQATDTEKEVSICSSITPFLISLFHYTFSLLFCLVQTNFFVVVGCRKEEEQAA